MKRKDSNDLRKKSVQELVALETQLRQELAREGLSQKTNPPKDTNALSKKRKMLAVVLTVMRQKQ